MSRCQALEIRSAPHPVESNLDTFAMPSTKSLVAAAAGAFAVGGLMAWTMARKKARQESDISLVVSHGPWIRGLWRRLHVSASYHRTAAASMPRGPHADSLHPLAALN